MASRFTQVVGELRLYEQDVIGDTVVDATWDSDPLGPNFSNQTTQTTSASAMFSSSEPGSFLVTVLMNLASGQKVKGQARIDVLKDLR